MTTYRERVSADRMLRGVGMARRLQPQPGDDFKAHGKTASDPHAAPQWDAFISHAWEDKESFVRPLAHALIALGALVWYDEFSLKLGDSLSASIDKGLAGSCYGIVVLSKAFITKSWPQRELEGLVAREIDGRSTILPVWHQLTREDVLEFSPPLANKLAAKTADTTADEIALQILSVIRPDIAGNTPYEELRRIATGEAVSELRDEISRLRSTLREYGRDRYWWWGGGRRRPSKQ